MLSSSRTLVIKRDPYVVIPIVKQPQRKVTKPKKVPVIKFDERIITESLLRMWSIKEDVPLGRGNYLRRSHAFRTFPFRNDAVLFTAPHPDQYTLLILAGEKPTVIAIRLQLIDGRSINIVHGSDDRTPCPFPYLPIKFGLSGPNASLVISRVDFAFRFADNSRSNFSFLAL